MHLLRINDVVSVTEQSLRLTIGDPIGQQEKYLMEEQNNKFECEPSLVSSEMHCSPASLPLGTDKKCSKSPAGFDPNHELVIENYSVRLVELIDTERDLASFELGLSMTNPASRRLGEVVQERRENREKIELLFSELGRKMWKGQLPPTTIAIVEQRYREMTNRLLSEELHDEPWSAYFSAFQLSIDILNTKSMLN